MPDGSGLIRKTKYKFFAFSLVGFITVLFISLAGLRLHSVIVDRQEKIQLIQENLFSQVFLIDKISILSKSVVFDDKKEASSIKNAIQHNLFKCNKIFQTLDRSNLANNIKLYVKVKMSGNKLYKGYEYMLIPDIKLSKIYV